MSTKTRKAKTVAKDQLLMLLRNMALDIENDISPSGIISWTNEPAYCPQGSFLVEAVWRHGEHMSSVRET